MSRLTKNSALTAAMRYHSALYPLDLSGIRTYESPYRPKKRALHHSSSASWIELATSGRPGNMADTMPNDDNPDWSEFTPAPLDYAAKLKATRARLSMTQDGFAALLHLPSSTLENWEQRRTEPDAFAQTIIDLIYEDPEGMAERL
jgi:putative transcriptional regulator